MYFWKERIKMSMNRILVAFSFLIFELPLAKCVASEKMSLSPFTYGSSYNLNNAQKSEEVLYGSISNLTKGFIFLCNVMSLCHANIDDLFSSSRYAYIIILVGMTDKIYNNRTNKQVLYKKASQTQGQSYIYQVL